jgi:predicted phosphodiesterase
MASAAELGTIPAMRLNILSDLHLGQGDLPLPRAAADVVILAGDIARPAQALAWAARLDKPVLYVAGNHEFYGSSIPATAARLKALSAGTRVCVLDDDEAIIGGVRFLGATLWTDFALFGPGQPRERAEAEGVRFTRDFSRIFIDEAQQQLFTPAHSALLFEQHAQWLAQRLAQPHAGPTVVITHHAPSPLSIHPRFAGSPVNACFVSNAEHLMAGDRVQLWVHGHTHDSFDYRVNGTRVVCNPRGYARDGVNENAQFDPDLMVNVG